MSNWGHQQLHAEELADFCRQRQCYVCEGGNRFDAEFCRHCHAPMALGPAEEHKKNSSPRLMAVLGAPGSGKTVYLGMLADLLSRHGGPLQLLARGAFSVCLQQQSVSALARRTFPPRTTSDPQGWNWVHGEVADPTGRGQLEIVMPDIPGQALLEEMEHLSSYTVIQAFLSRCSASIVLIDVDALERGDQEQDILATRIVSYLLEVNGDRRRGWPRRPIAFVFAKADRSEACFQDPAEYARLRTPALRELCGKRLAQSRFFAASAVGACAELRAGNDVLHIPLRIEPRGIVPPFAWLVERIGGGVLSGAARRVT